MFSLYTLKSFILTDVFIYDSVRPELFSKEYKHGKVVVFFVGLTDTLHLFSPPPLYFPFFLSYPACSRPLFPFVPKPGRCPLSGEGKK